MLGVYNKLHLRKLRSLGLHSKQNRIVFLPESNFNVRMMRTIYICIIVPIEVRPFAPLWA